MARENKAAPCHMHCIERIPIIDFKLGKNDNNNFTIENTAAIFVMALIGWSLLHPPAFTWLVPCQVQTIGIVEMQSRSIR